MTLRTRFGWALLTVSTACVLWAAGDFIGWRKAWRVKVLGLARCVGNTRKYQSGGGQDLIPPRNWSGVSNSLARTLCAVHGNTVISVFTS